MIRAIEGIIKFAGIIIIPIGITLFSQSLFFKITKHLVIVLCQQSAL